MTPPAAVVTAAAVAPFVMAASPLVHDAAVPGLERERGLAIDRGIRGGRGGRVTGVNEASTVEVSGFSTAVRK